MNILLQFNAEQLSGASVPSPVDDTGDVFWLQRGSAEARDWADAGVDNVLAPPLTEGASLGGGYDPRNHYAMGNRNPTRFGTREMAQQFSAILAANGINLVIDCVTCHMTSVGKDGYTSNVITPWGWPYRFPTDRTCFVGPHSRKDQVLDPANDYASQFGSQLATQNGYYLTGKGEFGRGYVLREMVKALNWYQLALDARGRRYDNLKSMAAGVVDYMQTHAPAGTWAVGEYYDGNPDTLSWVVFDSGIHGRISVFDFSMFFTLRDAANNASGFDMRRLRTAGFVNRAPMNSVVFIENHDTDSNGTGIKFNKLFAAAIGLTGEGLFCAYYKDWTGNGGYGLEHLGYKSLFWARRMLAKGPKVWRVSNEAQVSAYERTDWPGLLVGLNREPFTRNTQYRWMPTAFGPFTRLHDFAGRGPDIVTNKYGWVELPMPSGDGGPGWVCYSRTEMQGKSIPVIGRATTQRFEGANDLDISPATKLGARVMRLWCAPDREIRIAKPKGDGVRFQVIDEDGGIVVERGAWIGKTKRKGWHTVTAYAPTDTPVDYIVDITYWAPRGL